jgi:hypothetical protein
MDGDAMPDHDPKFCRYPTLIVFCPKCSELWAEQIREENVKGVE